MWPCTLLHGQQAYGALAQPSILPANCYTLSFRVNREEKLRGESGDLSRSYTHQLPSGFLLHSEERKARYEIHSYPRTRLVRYLFYDNELAHEMVHRIESGFSRTQPASNGTQGFPHISQRRSIALR